MSHRNTAQLSIQIILVLAILASFGAYVLDQQQKAKDAAKFREATRFANAGRWFWDVKKDKLEWDDTMFKIFNKDKATWTPDYAGFEECLDPADKLRIKIRVMDALKNKDGYTGMFRVVTNPEHPIHLIAAATSARDGSYMTGIVIPMTRSMAEDFEEITKAETP